MREARPIDLNYGHLGEPVYDSESKRWHFSRRPFIGRKLQPAGEPVVAFRGSLEVSNRELLKAAERSRCVKDLTHHFPELFPAACLTQDLAQTSEAIIQVTASHEPTASELLAYGRAVDIRKERPGVRTVPILACAAGKAGELVRVVQLAEEKLGWESKGGFNWDVPTAAHGEEGWWVGNGSPIQQLVFAEVEGESSYWLAVRYHGAISVLRPLLRSRPRFSNSCDTSGARLPQSRLEANHVATLPEQNGVPFRGVAFNPWNHQQIATVDQQGDWNVWCINISSRVKRKALGVITNSAGGHLPKARELDGLSPDVAADGWGAVLWASNQDILVVAARTAIAVFDIKSSSRQAQIPVLTSGKASDWILDVKRGSRDPCNVFVATSLCIFWLRISSSEREPQTAEMKSNVQCILSCRHFRNQDDISLYINILEVLKRTPFDDEAGPTLANATDYDSNTVATKLLLYSRMSGLVTVIAFQCAMPSSEQCPFALDPYPLELSMEEVGIARSARNILNIHTKPRILAVVLQPVLHRTPIEYMPSNLGQFGVTESVNYYQLSILTHDLTLFEKLYVEMNEASSFSDDLPSTRTRRGFPKTPAHVFDDFMVPDGFDNEGYQSSEENEEGPNVQRDFQCVKAESTKPDEDPWTITLGWLEKETHDLLSEPTPRFDENLEMLFAAVKARFAWKETPLATLHCILNTIVSVVDVDKSSTDFIQLLEDISQVKDEESEGQTGESKQAIVSSCFTPWMRNALKLGDRVQISTVYDTLIDEWIASMSRGIPGWARIVLEKLLRNLAANISLAGYGMRVVKEIDLSEEAPPGDATIEFVLPIRRMVSATSVKKGKEPAAMSSSQLATSQIPLDYGFQPSSPFRALPTPEPTPSLRSKSSASSLAPAEDPASARLKAYVSLAPQPALPIKMSNLLNHWEVGVDPTNYNWEAAQQAFNDEDESEDEAQAKQRQRAERRRKRHRQDTFGASSQPPSKRLGGSQPQLTQETQFNSQQTESMVIASQIEPGPSGGRLAKPKKKKQRAHGF
ncbi:hypothetical protein N7G274_006052 [Stereocaulon virgatum]|uniref:RNA polymerase I-specific transcription initiation factor RRN6-like protein n=1 Tax=Stereocaulon virgatum TaxID=373712 RepID=A0ABR4ACJ6_9LECA